VFYHFGLNFQLAHFSGERSGRKNKNNGEEKSREGERKIEENWIEVEGERWVEKKRNRCRE